MTTALPPDAQPNPPGVLPDEGTAEATSMLERNKADLFDALVAAGISEVIVSFDGYSDSGQIEDIDARTGSGSVPLPAAVITIARRQWGQPDWKLEDMTLSQAIEHLAYAALAETHSGWENDDGAYGEFSFDVARRSITLDYNERFTTSDYHQHTF